MAEWNYGEYEGTDAQTDPRGRAGLVNLPVDAQAARRRIKWVSAWNRVIGRSRAVHGNVALSRHGHALRALVARWIGLLVSGGEHFLLDPCTLCILGYYYNTPAARIWNGPVID